MTDKPRASDGAVGNRRAIVTGGAGFVGSHLVDRLLDEGCEVLVIDDLSTGVATNLAPAARLERADIVDANLAAIFGAWRPDVVFHLAAQASVPLSIADPLRDLAVNVIGTHRVAAAAREADAARIVFVSSGGAIYGETLQPATERTGPAPASYYGVHKLTAEGHVALSGIPFVIARPSNIYGTRQTAGLDGAVVASFVEQAIDRGRIRVDGDGTQTRDFVEVRDAVDALCRLSRNDVAIGTWNVATGRRISVSHLADVVEAALGRPVVREASPRRPGDVMHSSVSSMKLRGIGWRPRRTLETGVRDLIGRRQSTPTID